MVRNYLYVLLLTLFAYSASAQVKPVSWEYNFDHFGIQNGLPSSETYQVYQDKTGLLWILTDRGIVRYDGFRFRTYTVENGLSDNVNFRVMEAPDSSVWFIGANGLLSVYKNQKMQPYQYNSVLLKVFPMGTNIFNSFCIGPNQSIIYGVNRYRIFTVDRKGKIRTLLDKSKIRDKESVHIVEHNGYFANSISALHKRPVNTYFLRDGKWTLAGKFGYGGTTRLKRYRGHIFFISNKKLNVFLENRVKTFPNPNEVISLDRDEQFIYVGYYKNGVKKYRFDVQKKELILVQHYLPQYSVSSAYRDNNGSLWITTLEKGVFMIYDEAFRQLSINGTQVDDEIRFIDGNKEKVIMTYCVGRWQQLYPPYLLKDVGKTLVWHNLVPIRNRFAFQKGVVDWSDWPEVDGSYPYKPFHKSGSSGVVGMETNGLSVDVTAGGKRRVFDLAAVYKHRIPGVYVWFYFVPDKRIYFLLNEGVFSFDMTDTRAKGTYRNVLKKRINQLKHFEGWDLLAFSTTDGIFHIDTRNDRVAEFAPELKLGKQILTVFSDEKKRLWVATDKGIYLLEKKKGKIVLVRFLNRDLLSSREVTGLYSYNDILFVATKFGVQKINFFRIKPEFQECPIRLLSIRSFSNNRMLDESGIYPAKTDLIKIGLSNFKLNRRNIYRYRFRKDQTWIKSDKSEITLNDPVDGKYNLEVSYLQLSNRWSHPKLIASFEVEKILFLRWYFILLYVFLVVILFYLILKLSIGSVNKKNYMVNRMMELERMALAAQMNPHFIFNSLNSIHSFLLYEENENAEKYLIRFARLIRQTLANSRVTYITVEEEVETLKNYIILEKMRFKDAFTFEITCDLRRLPVKACIPPMLIQPYVENAILHGLVKRENGELRLQFLPEEDAIKVIIEDNGVGYAASGKKKRDSNHQSYGTQITEERLKSMQKNKSGKFTVSISSLDESDTEFPGTRVVLIIPIPD